MTSNERDDDRHQVRMMRLPAHHLHEVPLVIDRCAFVSVVAALSASGLAPRLPAQQTQLDVHGTSSSAPRRTSSRGAAGSALR